MIRLYHHFTGIRIRDCLGNITSGNSLLEALNRLLTVGKCLDLHKRDILARTAIHLTDNHILGHIHQTTCQVTGVRSTKRGVRKSLSRAMSRNEILQYVQSLTEIGLNRQLDGMAGGIRHQSAHSGKLLNLLIRTTGSRVSHHINIIIFIQSAEQVMRQLIVCILPGLNNLFIALLLRDQATAVVLGNLIHRCLSIRNQLRLGFRHGHI